MPPDRSRARSPPLDIDLEGSHLVWTDPLEPLSLSNPSSSPTSNATCISFTSTMTPTNYNYVPAPSKSAKKQASVESDVGPGEIMEPSTMIFQVNDKQVPPRKASSSSLSSPTRKKSHPYATASDSPPVAHIPRPPNAFILFRSSFIRSQQVSTEIETSHSTLSKIIGLTWKNLPQDEKKIWHDRARERMEEHRRRFPGYVFKAGGGGNRSSSTSSSTRAASSAPPSDPFIIQGSDGSSPASDSFQPAKAAKTKRRVREIAPPDPVRNEQIASLLLAGVKGTELETRMREFDKNHVREVHHRFEEIIVKDDVQGLKKKPSKPKLVVHTTPLPAPGLPLEAPWEPESCSPIFTATPIESKVDFALDGYAPQFDFFGMEMDTSPCTPQVPPVETLSYFLDPSQSYTTNCSDSFDFGFFCPSSYPQDPAPYYQPPISPCVFDFEPSYSSFQQEQQYDIGFGLSLQNSTGPNAVPMTAAYAF